MIKVDFMEIDAKYDLDVLKRKDYEGLEYELDKYLHGSYSIRKEYDVYFDFTETIATAYVFNRNDGSIFIFESIKISPEIEEISYHLLTTHDINIINTIINKKL